MRSRFSSENSSAGKKDDKRSSSGSLAFGRKFFGAVRQFYRKSGEDYLLIHSVYSTFFVFLSLFPMLMLILLLLSRFNISRDFFLREIIDLTPAAFNGIIESVFDNLADQTSGFMISLSAVFTIWSASSGVYGLMLGLNDIYRTYDSRPYIVRRSLCILYTFVLIAAVIVNIVLLGYGNLLSEFITKYLPALKKVTETVTTFRYPALFLVFTLFFNFLYWVLPNIRTRYFSHLPGAAFTSLGWILLSFLYSLYVDNLADFSIYGSLATFIMMILWLRYNMIILFLGAEINAMLLDARYGKDTTELRRLSRQQIHATENSIIENRRMTSEERYALRKPTTRKINTRLIREEQKKRQSEDKIK